MELEKTRLILLEDYLVLLHGLGCPGLKRMFSVPDLLQKVWLFHLRLGIWDFHPSWSLTLPLHWSFFPGVQMRPSPPVLHCLGQIWFLSRFSPRATHIQRKHLATRQSRINAAHHKSLPELMWYSTIFPNGMTGPLNGIPNRIWQNVFPSEQRSWLFCR